ncbi:MAG: lactonase family protein [Spirochaetes bacterium]|nr:lactonase family protein [Spirochaetota bacterium]
MRETEGYLSVFIGTYTEPIRFGTGVVLQGKGKGIYWLTLDLSDGSLQWEGFTEQVRNPSYLTVSPNRMFLYTVNELKEYEGKQSGSLTAYRIDWLHKRFLFLNRQPSLGTDPCHVTINSEGTHLFVSNFMSGSVVVFPIHADGSLGEPTDFIQHQGSSVDPVRQTGPHAHSLTLDLAERFAFVPDLGIDQIVIYSFDQKTGKLLKAPIPTCPVSKGAGPRHFEFHPSGRFAFLINELASTLQLYEFDGETGNLILKQTVSTLPIGYTGPNTCADLHVHPSGRFVYGSNRGHDSIVVFNMDEENGSLQYNYHQSTFGKTPRNFAVDPTGNYLVVANQDSDMIVTFKIDTKDGKLIKASSIEIPTPVCVKLIEYSHA